MVVVVVGGGDCWLLSSCESGASWLALAGTLMAASAASNS